MPKLKGLPGVSARAIPAVGFRTPGEGFRKLKSGIGLIVAGTHGSITAWVDDEGVYRADFSRHLNTKAIFSSRKKADLRTWLKEWMPRMESL